MLVLLAGAPQGAVNGADDEHRLMAMVLSRVLMFTRWTQDGGAPSSTLVVCAPPDHAVGEAMGRLGAPAAGRRILVRTSRDHGDGDCHVRLLGASTAPVERRTGVLLVGEGLGSLERGAMLGLQVQQGRVTFDVDLPAARRAGVEFDSQLLRLARFVRKEE